MLFDQHCIGWKKLLSIPSLSNMIMVAKNQNTEVFNSKIYSYQNHEKFKYFGEFVEWLAYHFLCEYGKLWDIDGVKMTPEDEDVGIDCEAFTPSNTLYPNVIPNTPIFIQIKGTIHSNCVFRINDKNHLPNFFAAAHNTAIKHQFAYNARYVVIHTGKCLSSRFKRFAEYEEIGYDDISLIIDGNYQFLNKLRNMVGLEEV